MSPGMPGLAALLNEYDYGAAAQTLDCEPAAIKAVAEVESAGAAFEAGRPVIRFESHIFDAKTGGRFRQSHPTLATKAWTPKLTAKTQAGEWQRLEQAKALDARAALLATSWGRFQIMGFNHAACGFGSVELFVEAMSRGEAEQLRAFVSFIQHRKLGDALRSRDWPAFARGYNGPEFAKNRYPEKLAAAYARHAKALP